MSDNKYYVMPLDEFSDIVKPYVEALDEIMADECMLLQDVIEDYFRTRPKDTSTLMEYACEFYSQCLDGDIDIVEDSGYQAKLDRAITCIHEATDVLGQKLEPYLDTIAKQHPGREDWSVFRLQNELVCIGVGINESTTDLANRPVRQPKERGFIQR